jgi:hypothetical protein
LGKFLLIKPSVSVILPTTSSHTSVVQTVRCRSDLAADGSHLRMEDMLQGIGRGSTICHIRMFSVFFTLRPENISSHIVLK